jgi:hypothetical protein
LVWARPELVETAAIAAAASHTLREILMLIPPGPR